MSIGCVVVALRGDLALATLFAWYRITLCFGFSMQVQQDCTVIFASQAVWVGASIDI